MIFQISVVYFVFISLLTSVVAFLDKSFAKRRKRRVSEATLFTLALLGGALAEYVTMKLIRHKTLHKRFMLGLPAIILLQAICLYFILTHF